MGQSRHFELGQHPFRLLPRHGVLRGSVFSFRPAELRYGDSIRHDNDGAGSTPGDTTRDDRCGPPREAAVSPDHEQERALSRSELDQQ